MQVTCKSAWDYCVLGFQRHWGNSTAVQRGRHRRSCQDEATTTQTPELSQTCTGGDVTQTLSLGHTCGRTQTQTHELRHWPR